MSSKPLDMRYPKSHEWIQRGRKPDSRRVASGIRRFFVGVMLVDVGSAGYHYAPSTAALVWDRLPMTIAFMALFAVVIADGIATGHARIFLWLFILAGAGSIGYWQVTETRGADDLRPYLLVQFLPMVLIPLTLVLNGTRYASRNAVLAGINVTFMAFFSPRFQ